MYSQVSMSTMAVRSKTSAPAWNCVTEHLPLVRANRDYTFRIDRFVQESECERPLFFRRVRQVAAAKLFMLRRRKLLDDDAAKMILRDQHPVSGDLRQCSRVLHGLCRFPQQARLDPVGELH